MTLVPERRAELTTEGGLDVVGQFARVAEAVARCRDAGLEVSLFIDPDPAQVEASHGSGPGPSNCTRAGTPTHATRPTATGNWPPWPSPGRTRRPRGLALHAGHGLNYQNVGPVARIAGMAELNIGHSIVSRAVFVGMERAVREMKACIDRARASGVRVRGNRDGFMLSIRRPPIDPNRD